MRNSRWEDIILQCQNRPAEMSAKQWITENQVSEKSYYYWQRKLRKEAFEQMDHSPLLPAVQDNSEISFAELRIPEPKRIAPDIVPKNIRPTAVNKTATMTIALSNDIADDLQQKFLEQAD